jgi:hypothetical protein
MKEPNEEFAQPLLNDLIYDPSIKLLEKKDEEMRDSYEKYNKLLNKMKKNVDNMGSNKLMNYQNLFNEYNNDVIKFNEEQKKLIELKDSLNSEIKLPPKIKKNLDKVNKDFENKQKLFEKIKTKVEEYKDKYTKEENKKYDEIFGDVPSIQSDTTFDDEFIEWDESSDVDKFFENLESEEPIQKR